MINVSIRQAISAPEVHHSHACAACDNSVIQYIRISACIVIVSCRVRFVANSPAGCCTITVCNCCLTIEPRHQSYTVPTVSLIMTAAHVATVCPLSVCDKQRVLSEKDCSKIQIVVHTCCGVGAQRYANCSKKDTINAMLCQSKNRSS